MNGRSKSLMLGAVVLVLVVATTGCGSKKKSSTPPAATTTAAATTTTSTETTTETSTSSSDTSGLSSIATASNCKSLSDLSASFSKAVAGVGTNDFEKRADILKEFADKTPSDIRPDFEVLADAFKKYASALKGIHYTPGKVPDAATIAKLQKLSTSIDQASVTKASSDIAAWAQKNCTKKS